MSASIIGVQNHEHGLGRSEPEGNSRNPLIKKARSIRTLFQNTKIIVHVLVCIFAVASWADMNGMWAQLPLLVEKAHEGWTLPSYIIVISQVANIGPLIFILISCLAPQTKPKLEKVTSFLIIILGMVACFMLAFLWEYTTDIGGSQHSTALLTLNFFLAVGDCTSSVSFYAFMAYMKPEYIATLFVGEGLSGLIPSVIAIGQGVGEIVCNGTMPISTEPNFSVRVYFIILSGILLVSALAFLLLNFWNYCKSEMVTQPASEEVIIPQPKHPNAMYGTLDSVSQSSEDRASNGLYPAEDDDKADVTKHSHASTSGTEVTTSTEVLIMGTNESSQSSSLFRSIRNLVKVQDISMWIFFFLLAQIIFINMTLTSFLPTIQIYSVLPYGLQYYHLATTLPQIANPVACLFALFFMAEHAAIIFIVTILGEVGLGYIIYVAVMSPTPPLHGENGGGELAVSMLTVLDYLLAALYMYYVFM
ncbi:unnamed protein product [Candidula unifasciata]|uniref:Riboflavin transporter n=1 Tax=Candidula unifasciata TaxID=100452 RepID=A0A8S3YZM7_9EUPU|nr:unnamed protein product [Candidula unifasciata]